MYKTFAKKTKNAKEFISMDRTKTAVSSLIEHGIVEVVGVESDGTEIFALTELGKRLHGVRSSGNQPD